MTVRVTLLVEHRLSRLLLLHVLPLRHLLLHHLAFHHGLSLVVSLLWVSSHVVTHHHVRIMHVLPSMHHWLLHIPAMHVHLVRWCGNSSHALLHLVARDVRWGVATHAWLGLGL